MSHVTFATAASSGFLWQDGIPQIATHIASPIPAEATLAHVSRTHTERGHAQACEL